MTGEGCTKDEECPDGQECCEMGDTGMCMPAGTCMTSGCETDEDCDGTNKCCDLGGQKMCLPFCFGS